MNTTFHMLAGVATAAAYSQTATRRPITVLGLGFATSVALHGVMDYVPHSYPIKPAADVILALALFAGAFCLAKREARPLLIACCLGAIFPDLVDLASAILNRRAGLSLPVVHLFPWHWKEYSGSIYDGSRRVASFSAHLLVLLAVAGSIYSFRSRLFGRKG